MLDILTDPSLPCLIDDLFFEHHVRNEAMRLHWGGATQHSIYKSLRLFQALRRVGVFAHSWP